MESLFLAHTRLWTFVAGSLICRRLLDWLLHRRPFHALGLLNIHFYNPPFFLRGVSLKLRLIY